ncbi:MAG: hypothetical protein JSV61_06620, partial [Anaerolineales bacterium]
NAYVTAGVLNAPANSDTVSNLAEIIWMITEFWLSSIEVSGQIVDESQMERGVQLMMLILEPYIQK